MASIKRHGTILQPRDLHLLRELGVMRVFDREQARIVGEFGSGSRTNRRLRALTDAGLLRRSFLGSAAAGRKAIHTLSPKGALLVGAPHRGLQRRRDEVVATDSFIEHQLTVNTMYCSLKYRPIPVPGVDFVRWVPFYVPLSPGLPLIPDGYIELSTPQGVIGHFLEIDLGTETRSTWQRKVENYLKLALSDDCEKLIGQRSFGVLVIANSERRLLSIRTVVSKAVEMIFWFAALPDIAKQGFFGPIWLRPIGETRIPLIQQP